MNDPISGIHHITAIAGDPQRNLDFYTQVLGLRLIKLTVNFDDPGTYHFYFADGTGHPGTVLTFFPWANARKGRGGAGQVLVTAFHVPQNSLGYWAGRLSQHGVTVSSPLRRFDEEVLPLLDPDGLPLELVASDNTPPGDAWDGGPVPGEKGILGFAAPALLVNSLAGTANLLTGLFGMTRVEHSGGRVRFSAGAGIGGLVDVEERPNEQPGRMGTGVVHHIAFRARDDAHQLELREALLAGGYQVTPVRDRQYFHSIYFNEPGGILFEIATDGPGFATDETVGALGTALKLPPWFESSRPQIERALPPLKLPVIG